ncbi:hypothetical protein EDB80DRAFT_167242 [Ilyonectria destructans]|nr:hypothetical protein EDB80DRAFT_167242 [Ilyonectria destructans]
MNFGFSDDASGSSNWLGFGRSQRNASATSPGVGAAASTGAGAVATSPNDLNPDETSFAESYRPETSPLFNPMFLPRSDAIDAAPPSALSSTNAPGWDWQRDSAPVESNNYQSSPLARGARAQSLDLSTEVEAPALLEKTDAQEPVDASRRESSPLQGSAAQSADAEKAKQNAMNSGGSDNVEVQAQDQGLGAEITEETIEATNHASKEAATTESLGSQSPVSTISNEMNQPETEEMVVDSEPPAPKETKHSASGEEDADESGIPPPSTAKRGRRNASEMLNAAAKSIVKNIDGPRKRLSFIPWSPVVKPTPVAKRGRKSMPARIDAETPRKRGRPRKSETVATPATTTKSPAKRGRPRKSDAPGAIMASATKTRAGPTPRRTTSIFQTPGKSPLKAVQTDSSAATPNKVGRPRKTPAKDTPAVTTEPPKRRGRPPKNTPQPSSVKPVASRSSGRGLRSTDESLPAKRAVKPRAVPSPAKRGRPARKAAAPASKPALDKPAATRGRRAAVKADNKGTAAAAAPNDPPKRRGRPPKNATASKAEEPTAKPETKKRGRGATVPETASVPAPKKRGRAAQAKTDDAAPAAAKPRGRPKRTQPEADAPEPPAKKQRTTRAAEKPTAPARRTGRGAAKEAVEKDTTSSTRAKTTRSKPEAAPAAAEPPKAATRGRGAAKLAADKPAPKPRGVAAKSGKGELPSSKTATEEKPKRASGRGAGPTGVVKKTAEKAAPRRALRSRG